MNTLASSFESIEPLEPRIAPAAVATFTDVDGDLVKITSSKGTQADLQSATHVTAGQLTLLDLSEATWGNEFAGAAVKLAVSVPGAAGDGAVNVGYVNATGIDLGSLAVNGDVGKIAAGVAGAARSAQSIRVLSLGKFGTATGAPDVFSDLASGCGSFSILGDVWGAGVDVAGKIGTLAIGGSIHGQTSQTPGVISCHAFGTARVGGSIFGGSGSGTGYLELGDGGSLSIGGSLYGANGYYSGGVLVGKVGSVKLGGNIQGGVDDQSGQLIVNRSAGSVSMGGSIVGGAAEDTGVLNVKDATVVKIGGHIEAGTSLSSGLLLLQTATSVTVGGDLIGGSQSDTGSIVARGTGCHVGAITIGGSLSGGGGGADSAAIDVTTLGSVKIGGNVSNASIMALGLESPANAAQAVAIKSITVGGSVQYSSFVAGDFVYKNARIGTVSVQGDWIGSNLVAGVRNLGTGDTPGGTGTATDNLNFGDAHDLLALGGTNPAITARIASITIGGQVTGSAGGTDHYGFVAQEIGAFQAGGTVIPLQSGSGNDNRTVGLTGDVVIHEV